MDGAVDQNGQLDKVFVRKVNLRTGGTGAGFGVNGLVTFAPVAARDGEMLDFSVRSMMATNDGGVIVAVQQHFRVPAPGEPFPAEPIALVLHRLDAAGKLDGGFGNKGAVTATLTEEYDYLLPTRLAAYGDGRFLMMGGTQYEPTLERFKADGSHDPTFGDDGVVLLEAAGLYLTNGVFRDVVLEPDGEILVSASTEDISGQSTTAILARFRADGTRDMTFGEKGTVVIARSGDTSHASDVTVDAAGRIVGAVRVANDVQLYRLTPENGAPDPTFDDDGFTTIPQPPDTPGLSWPYYGSDLAIDAAGNILLGRNAHVSRFADGQPRVGMGSDGVVHVDGTEGADTVMAALAGDTLTVTFNGASFTFATADVRTFVVTGGGGDDRFDLAAAAFATMTVNGGDGSDSIVTGDAADHINCDAGDDTVHAGGGKDLIFGGDGGDSIWGDAGDDHVFGEFGNDSISGGSGNDRLYGGHTYTIEPDEYSSGWDGDDSLSGNAGNDRCNGQTGNDRVAGNGGRDRLFGNVGNDRFYGGASGDFLYGDSGSDQLFGDGGLDRLYGDGDTYSGYAGDTLHGNAGDDVLYSRDSNADELFGDGGRDTSVADESDILSSIESRT